MRSVVFPVFLTMSFSPASAATQQDILNRLLAQYEQAIVYLEVEQASGGVLDRGTGFIVSHDGYIVTAAHIRPDQNQTLVAVIGQRQGTRYSLLPREEDVDNDVALWQLPQTSDIKVPVMIGTKSVKLYDNLITLGFPKEEGLSAASIKITNLSSSARGFYKTDGLLQPGNSGGPVFNEDGEVVAIVQGGTLPGTENNDIVPISLAVNLMRKRGIPLGGAPGCSDDRRYPRQPGPLVCIPMYPYSGNTREASRKFDYYRQIIAGKLHNLAMVFSGTVEAKYLTRLSVFNLAATSPPSLEQKRAHWINYSALELMQGIITQTNGDYWIKSQIFLGDLGAMGNYLGKQQVTVDLLLSADELSTIADSHSLVTLFALAMDAKRLNLPAPYILSLLAEAEDTFADLRRRADVRGVSVDSDVKRTHDAAHKAAEDLRDNLRVGRKP